MKKAMKKAMKAMKKTTTKVPNETDISDTNETTRTNKITNEINNQIAANIAANRKSYHIQSQPINIPTTTNITSSNIFTGEYVVVDNSGIIQNSEPTKKIKTITNSFKDYLYSSVNVLRDSYNYLTTNKSI